MNLGSVRDHPITVLFPGVSERPEQFLDRKFEGLRRRGINVIRAGSPSNSLLLTRPDIIHFEWNSAAIDALSLVRLWEVPVVISCRGTQIRVRPFTTPGYADQIRETFRRATVVHTVCMAIRNEAVALGLDPTKAEVIRSGVDLSEFQPRSAREHAGPLRLVAVGALIWVKGYEYLLSALRLLVDRGVDVHLEIVGTGDEMQRISFSIADLGLQDRVTMRGRLSFEDVRTSLANADVFVHSSLSEGISNAVLEAMASGLPVVTSDCGGMREAVTDGHEGYVVPLRSPVAMADAVEVLGRDPAFRSRMGLMARKSIESSFNLDAMVSKFVDLYSRLVSEPG